MRKLAHGLADYSREFSEANLDERAVFDELNGLAQRRAVAGGFFAENLNRLIAALGINVNSLAKFVNYDASYISRIRSGQRSPSNTERFAAGVAVYVTRMCENVSQRLAVAELLGSPKLQDADDAEFSVAVQEWLCTSRSHTPPVEHILRALDELQSASVQLAEYMEDDLFASVGELSGDVTCYHGGAGVYEGELAFMRQCLARDSVGRVTIYGDMPLEIVLGSGKMRKRWASCIAALLARNATLHIVHNVERPMTEMAAGIESWLPMYMTGKVRATYLRPPRDAIFTHLLCVSDTCALVGNGIAGHPDQSSAVLLTAPEEVSFYREYAYALTNSAMPLIDVFKVSSFESFRDFLRQSLSMPGQRVTARTTLPLHTASRELIQSIVARAGVTEQDQRFIVRHAARFRDQIEQLLATERIVERVPVLTREEFDANPLIVGLGTLFFDRDIAYTYDEYEQHLELTRAFAMEHPGYELAESKLPQFKNIQIIVCHGQWALVSKSAAPQVHFLIRHPRLVEALEQFATR